MSALKTEGDTALQAGNALDAVRAYTGAYALKPLPNILYNRGRAYQALGRYPEALDDLEAFERDAPADQIARVPNFSLVLRDVRAHVGKLVVRCDQADASVRIGDRSVGTTPLANALRVNTGPGSIEIKKQGFVPYRADIANDAKMQAELDVKLLPVTPEPQKERSILGTWWFWTGAGVLVAGGVVGAILLTRPASAETGSLPPGQLTVPLRF